MMTALSSDNLLHIEMREAKERTSVRYSGFQLALAPNTNLGVEFYFPTSSAPDSLTPYSSLAGGCKSIF